MYLVLTYFPMWQLRCPLERTHLITPRSNAMSSLLPRCTQKNRRKSVTSEIICSSSDNIHFLLSTMKWFEAQATWPARELFHVDHLQPRRPLVVLSNRRRKSHSSTCRSILSFYDHKSILPLCTVNYATIRRLPDAPTDDTPGQYWHSACRYWPNVGERWYFGDFSRRREISGLTGRRDESRRKLFCVL